MEVATPANMIYGSAAQGLYNHMLNNPHLLIAGTTGSGKSTLIDCLIYQQIVAGGSLVLIDPKHVGLLRWRNAPGVLHVVDEPAEAAPMLARCVAAMERRYRELAARGETDNGGNALTIIVDEFAALTMRDKTVVSPLLDLAQMGRAAGIQLILATQSPSRQVITPAIRLNMPAAVALRCQSAIESRQIIGQAGAECLPRWGQGIYMAPDLMQPVQVDLPPVPPELLQRAMQPAQTAAPARRGSALPGTLQRGQQLAEDPPRRRLWPFNKRSRD